MCCTPTKQGTCDILGKISFWYHCKESICFDVKIKFVLQLFEMWPFVFKTVKGRGVSWGALGALAPRVTKGAPKKKKKGREKREKRKKEEKKEERKNKRGQKDIKRGKSTRRKGRHSGERCASPPFF